MFTSQHLSELHQSFISLGFTIEKIISLDLKQMHYAEKRENEQHHVVLKRSLSVIISPDPKSELN